MGLPKEEIKDRNATPRRRRGAAAPRLDLHSLFETAPVGFALLDAEFRFVSVNAAFARMVGWAAADHLGKTIDGVVDDVWQEALSPILQRAASGEPPREHVFPLPLAIRPVGASFVAVTCYSFSDNPGARFGLTVTDVTERVGGDVDLLNREERLRLAADAAGVGTWDFHPQTGERHWDTRAKASVGLPLDAEISDGTFLSAIHPEDRDRVADALRRAFDPRSGGTFRVECRTVGLTDGILRWIASSGRAYFDRAGRPVRFIGTVTDITTRRQREEEVRYLATHARCLLWHGEVLLREDGSLDWRTRVFDEAAALAFIPLELAPGEPFVTAWYRHRLPEGKLLTTEVCYRALRQDDRRYEAEFGCRTAVGEVRWYYEVVHVEPIAHRRWRLVGVTTDITERKKTEEALRESETQLRALVEGVENYALFVLDPEGNVVRWNPGVKRLFGYDAAEIVGRHVSLIYAPEDAERGIPAEELRRASREGAFGEDRWHIRRDGTRFWATGVVQPIFDRGRVCGYTKVMGDITHYKEAEQVLRRAYQAQHRVSDALQQMLLLSPPEDKVPGLSVGTGYAAAWDEASFGGDFFDAFTLADGASVALVVGDASGKGLAAAMRTSEVKFALRAFLRENPDPAAAMARLNDFVVTAERLDRPVGDEGSGSVGGGANFTALLVAVVDPRSGAAVLAAAGAEPPLLHLAADGIVASLRLDDGAGMPLGLFAGETYGLIPFSLRPGDAILLFSDGITEARRDGAFFLADALQNACGDALARHPDDLPTAAESIIDAARSFARGPLKDDACLLIARRRAS
jgi:PAS domain S-box-containing protein